MDPHDDILAAIDVFRRKLEEHVIATIVPPEILALTKDLKINWGSCH